MSTKIEVRRQLRLAVRNLDAHGLQLSSKWASEQLVGMDVDNDTDEISFHENTSNIPSQEYDLLLFAKNLLNNGEYQRCAHLLRRKPTRKDCNGDSKKGTTTSIPASTSENGVVCSTLGLFLSAYSMYMAGEKLNEQQQTSDNINSGNLFPGMIGSTATTDKQSNSEGQNKVKPKINEKAIGYDREYKKNPFLNELFIELDLLYKKEKMDGFLLYLFAIVVRDLVKQGQVQGQGGPYGLSICNPSDSTASGRVQGKEEGLSAYSLFIKSLKNYPWNWSCWLELSELCATEKLSPPTWQQVDPMSLDSSSKPQMPSSSSSSSDKEMRSNGQEGRVMYLCFLAHYYLELQQGEKAMKVLEGVLHVFPNSQLVTSQVALSYYCMRDYEKAQNVFEQARENDPHKIEHLDAYSNILYVREKRAELSFLAHSAMRLAPLTPETCCVVGNYYSLKGKHERAILYFQRALKLNPKCLSAWTLMGHECVELRNTAAAVQCYRKAVDVSSGGDYRAWYGLGQTYEMLHMYQYALHYYKNAAALRPSDGRMWCAVGNCLCRLGTKAEATKAFERAVAVGDREGVATRELARLYRDEGLASKAAECYYHHLLLTGGETLVRAVQKVVQGVATMSPGGMGEGSGHMDELISGVDDMVDGERAEALLYLAGYYKGKGFLSQAELLCSRLMDKVGSEGDEARAMMREIRTLSLKSSGAHQFDSVFAKSVSTSFSNSGLGISRQNVDPKIHSTPSLPTYQNNRNNSNIYEDPHEEDIGIEPEEDSMEFDIGRIEGELSMSISGSEGGGLDESVFLSP